MCGSLRRERMGELVGKDPQPEMLIAGWGGRGDNFPVVGEDGILRLAQFNGHARSEKLDQWHSSGWIEADLHVSKYTEGHGTTQRDFDVAKGHTLHCVIRQVAEDKWVFNIITRDAIGEELETHPRFPIVGPRRY